MWQHVVGDLVLQCLQEPKFIVSGLSGHKLKYLGETVVSIKLGNTAYEMCVQVVQNNCTCYDGIIGLGFLKQYRALYTDGPTSRVKDYRIGSREPASPVKITQSPVHLVAAESALWLLSQVFMWKITALVEPARECDVLNNQHCYVARSVTTVMPHEGKVEASVNMSRAEIAGLELLEK
ncbi:hypothetical protein PR048_004316 [Dryococelus australis]|uniref:Peptidase A1 domain-containing protein n=1 Tax=Dryococelus australis TaxID=614101 RepID=A0ABQ9I536_9NEOP|nr:hypothetical protein PR048_004316 [Dryococelus australis]